MWRRCALALARRLVDDFPRPLTRFEKARISQSLTATLKAFPSSVEPETVDRGTLPDKERVVLANLSTWPLPVALKTLCETLSVSEHAEAISKDGQFLDFFANFFSPSWRESVPTFALVDALEIIVRVDPESIRVSEVLEELIQERDPDSLGFAQMTRVVCAVKRSNAGKAAWGQTLTKIAQESWDKNLMIEAVPLGLETGKMLIPEILFATLSKAELIRVLVCLEECEFPDTVAAGVTLISDALTRLSFNRLVSDEEKDQVLLTLAKLKSKLDRVAYIENNPFYIKNKRQNFLGKICRTLSYDFRHAATALPLPVAAEKMLALSSLNALQLKAVDLIANRISSFGDKLLLPDVMPGPAFAALTHALLSHPQVGRRQDRFRALIASPLARALRLYIAAGTLSPHQKLICCQALMVVHNESVRSAVAQVIDTLDVSQLRPADLVSLSRISSVLLRHDDSNVDCMARIVAGIPLETLSTPQLVELLDTCRQGRVVGSVASIVRALDDRLLQSGGSISTFNAVRALDSIGELQVRGASRVCRTLSIAASESEIDSRLRVRFLSGLASASISNPELREILESLAENILLTISEPGHLRTIVEEGRSVRKLNQALNLLGTTGAMFRDHLQLIPVGSAGSQIAAEGGPRGRSFRDALESVGNSDMPCVDNLLGNIPATTSFVGDLLGALLSESTDSSELVDSGGFQLRDAYTWCHASGRIMITIVRARQCARDDHTRILGSAAARIATDRFNGWQVIVLPETILQSALHADSGDIKKRLRRAKIIHKADTPLSNLRAQIREILTG